MGIKFLVDDGNFGDIELIDNMNNVFMIKGLFVLLDMKILILLIVVSV